MIKKIIKDNKLIHSINCKSAMTKSSSLTNRNGEKMEKWRIYFESEQNKLI